MAKDLRLILLEDKLEKVERKIIDLEVTMEIKENLLNSLEKDEKSDTNILIDGDKDLYEMSDKLNILKKEKEIIQRMIEDEYPHISFEVIEGGNL
jgi:signal recognition particle GTPase